jgi:hypothetical protein
MQTRTRPVKLIIPLPAADHRIFISAIQVLRRIMREQTPDVVTLIQSKLLNHDVTGLAEDYLDQVAWPHARRSVILPGISGRAARQSAHGLTRPRQCQSVLKIRPGRNRAIGDPSRN